VVAAHSIGRVSKLNKVLLLYLNNLPSNPGGKVWIQLMSQRPVRIYFRLVFALTWGVGAVGLFAPRWIRALPQLTSSNPLWYVAASVPGLVGLLLTAYYDGRQGMRRLLARLIPWRVGLHWYLIVLIGFPLLGLLAGRIAGLFSASQGRASHWGQFYYQLLPTLMTDPGPLGEELGWRGFALPRLLERWSPLTASLLLGVIWGLWHLPIFFIPGLPQSRLSFAVFLLGTISLCIIDTWIFLRTDGNLVPMILVHLMSNYCNVALEISFPVFVAAEVAWAVIILISGGLTVLQTKRENTAEASFTNTGATGSSS
jgi:membrane protease YdiL (CAAX protease family)